MPTGVEEIVSGQETFACADPSTSEDLAQHYAAGVDKQEDGKAPAVISPEEKSPAEEWEDRRFDNPDSFKQPDCWR